MNGDQAIRAGVLAIVRRETRKIHAGAPPVGAKVTFVAPDGAHKTIEYDRFTAKVLIEAADLDLSNRLGTLGVSELDETPLLAAPRPDPVQPAPARRVRRKPGPDTEPA